jgi:hypothetical protein
MEREVFGILKPPRVVGRRGTLPGSLLTRKPNRKPSAMCRLHGVFTDATFMQANVTPTEGGVVAGRYATKPHRCKVKVGSGLHAFGCLLDRSHRTTFHEKVAKSALEERLSEQ